MSAHPELVATPALLDDPGFGPLRDYLVALTGMAYYRQREPELAARLARRLRTLGLDSCAAYLRHLRHGGEDAALGDVADLLSIGETYFFRHVEQLEAIVDRALVEVSARAGDRHCLRIWSAGCATGAEPYTLAILVRRRLGLALADWDVSIVGTDMNDRFLDVAQRAVYSSHAMRRVPDEVRDECFRPGPQGWELLAPYRQGVTFRRHNLARHPVPCALAGLVAFDAILCRNVAIYFDADLAARLASGFRRALVDGGWLALGHAETGGFPMEGFRCWQTAGATLYQRQGDPASARAPARSPHLHRAAAPASPMPVRPGPWPGQGPRPQVAPAGAPTPAAAIHVRDSAQAAPSSGAAAREGDLAQGGASSGAVERVRDLADAGHWLEALRASDQAAAAHRLDGRAQLWRSLVLDGMGRRAAATAAARQAVYLDRRDPLAHYWLGFQAGAGGDRATARRSLANALDLLAERAGDEILDERDGLRVDHLRDLARIHLEALAGHD